MKTLRKIMVNRNIQGEFQDIPGRYHNIIKKEIEMYLRCIENKTGNN